MKFALILAVCVAVLVTPAVARAQAAVGAGPTIDAARSGFSVPVSIRRGVTVSLAASVACGSPWRNAVMLGLGLSLATGVLELTYTLLREPVVRNGGSWPRADPALMAWAGGAGFVAGLFGTEVCRRRNR